jgi:hypothetical protein
VQLEKPLDLPSSFASIEPSWDLGGAASEDKEDIRQEGNSTRACVMI